MRGNHFCGTESGRNLLWASGVNSRSVLQTNLGNTNLVSVAKVHFAIEISLQPWTTILLFLLRLPMSLPLRCQTPLTQISCSKENLCLDIYNQLIIWKRIEGIGVKSRQNQCFWAPFTCSNHLSRGLRVQKLEEAKETKKICHDRRRTKHVIRCTWKDHWQADLPQTYSPMIRHQMP